MLKLLLGRAGTGKTRALLEAMAAGDGRPQILIVPDQHSHSMERQLCAIGGSRVSLFAEVLSFTRLANRVFSVYGGLAAPALDGGGRLLLLCAALKSVAPELRVYQRPSRKPAFLSGLLATVDELKTCRITPEQLWTAGEESGGGEGDKLRDLSLIYGAYEAMTARQGADPRDRLTRLAEALTREDWAVGKDFYLDAFTDFTPQEPATSWRRTRGARGFSPPPAAPPASSSGWPRSGAFPGKLRCVPAGPGPRRRPWPNWRASSLPPGPPPMRARRRSSPC